MPIRWKTDSPSPEMIPKARSTFKWSTWELTTQPCITVQETQWGLLCDCVIAQPKTSLLWCMTSMGQSEHMKHRSRHNWQFSVLSGSPLYLMVFLWSFLQLNTLKIVPVFENKQVLFWLIFSKQIWHLILTQLHAEKSMSPSVVPRISCRGSSGNSNRLFTQTVGSKDPWLEQC